MTLILSTIGIYTIRLIGLSILVHLLYKGELKELFFYKTSRVLFVLTFASSCQLFDTHFPMFTSISYFIGSLIWVYAAYRYIKLVLMKNETNKINKEIKKEVKIISDILENDELLTKLLKDINDLANKNKKK